MSGGVAEAAAGEVSMGRASNFLIAFELAELESICRKK